LRPNWDALDFHKEKNIVYSMAATRVLGLTGGICGGKSAAARFLGSQTGRPIVNLPTPNNNQATAPAKKAVRVSVLDADQLGHAAYSDPNAPAFAAIARAFPAAVAGQKQDQIDRAKLGAIVFGDPGAMRRLTGIVWPAIGELAKREIAALKHPAGKADDGVIGLHVIVLEAAVLVEAGWQGFCDDVWCFEVPPKVAVSRLAERNGLSAAEAEKRLASQLSNDGVCFHLSLSSRSSFRLTLPSSSPRCYDKRAGKVRRPAHRHKPANGGNTGDHQEALRRICSETRSRRSSSSRSNAAKRAVIAHRGHKKNARV
jgi:dephospho-CoA kinase